jgi:hypothetical protein
VLEHLATYNCTEALLVHSGIFGGSASDIYARAILYIDADVLTRGKLTSDSSVDEHTSHF